MRGFNGALQGDGNAKLDAIVRDPFGRHGDDLSVDQLGTRLLALGGGPVEIVVDCHDLAKRNVHVASLPRARAGGHLRADT
jgi:hypothetical protein